MTDDYNKRYQDAVAKGPVVGDIWAGMSGAIKILTADVNANYVLYTIIADAKRKKPVHPSPVYPIYNWNLYKGQLLYRESLDGPKVEWSKPQVEQEIKQDIVNPIHNPDYDIDIDRAWEITKGMCR